MWLAFYNCSEIMENPFKDELGIPVNTAQPQLSSTNATTRRKLAKTV